MRFLVDECTGPSVASWLRDNDYEVFSVFEELGPACPTCPVKYLLSEI